MSDTQNDEYKRNDYIFCLTLCSYVLFIWRLYFKLSSKSAALLQGVVEFD